MMPSNNSQLGFYYSPDSRHYRQSDLYTILPALKSVQAGWLTMQGSTKRAIPEAFIEGLLDAGIRPIIHIPSLVGSFSLNEIRSLLTAYAHWGVNHVIVFDRPNLKSSWVEGEWSRGNLVERFADRLIPILEMQVELGLVPVLPPLEPGGDYWDLAFIKSLLLEIKKRLSPESQTKLKIAAYAWTNDKPLDWGAGGPDAWPEARPYHTPQGIQDHRGFRLFEWYEAVAESIYHRRLPILVVAGGASALQASKSGSDLETNQAIARMIFSQSLPPYLEAFSFYNLYDPCEADSSNASWLSKTGQSLQPLEALQQTLHNDNHRKAKTLDKRFAHYVLLPVRSQHQSMLAWAEVGPYVIEHRPIVGFSLDEAKLAHRVTLAGTEAAYPASIKEDLISAGCEVRLFERPTELSQPKLREMNAVNGVPQE